MNPWLQFAAGNVVAATLIGLLAWQVGRSGRRATLAHLLWLAFFVKLVTPPIVLLPIHVPQHWLPTQQVAKPTAFSYPTWNQNTSQDSSPTVASSQASSAGSAIVQASSLPRHSIPRPSWQTCVLAIWLTGAIVVMVRGVIYFVKFHRLLSREAVVDQQAAAFVRSLAKAAGRRRAPPVLRIPIRVSPMLFGIGRKTMIVCPDQLWSSLTERQRQAFLAHETAHFCRRDHWVRWLEWVVTALYWWFPGVYIARHQLERHEEACCDAWAVQRLETPPRSYAEALLHVVDFISDNGARVPRLASAMQPTDSLEERLRLVMQGHPETGSYAGWFAGTACLSFWLIHPVALPAQPRETVARLRAADTVVAETQPPVSPAVMLHSEETADDLPDAPKGFWNEPPRGNWASFALNLPGAQLVADAWQGITISVPGRKRLEFRERDLTALVEIPATQRVVIGDRDGRIRLWDLRAGMPVSLIGRHTSEITSVDYNQTHGLVVADAGGSVMSWDLQSGHVYATWSVAGAAQDVVDGPRSAIQSLRYSHDGEWIAVLTGRWNDRVDENRLYLIDSRTLETVASRRVRSSTAVVVDSYDHGWITVDWSGAVRSLESGETLATINKCRVSALVLAHQPEMELDDQSFVQSPQ